MKIVLLFLISTMTLCSHVSAQQLPEDDPTRDYAVCRFKFTSDRIEPSGSGWSTDFPLADRNLMYRLGDLTTMSIAKNLHGDVAHRVVEALDGSLWSCPILLLSDAGTMSLSEDESLALRTYLTKGGFLWSDDTWGTLALEQLYREFDRILPGYRLLELPMSHELFRTTYTFDHVPQISNVGFWAHSKETSERGEETATPIALGIEIDGRLTVLVTHDTDIGDTWEREANRDYFEEFAHVGYAFGINVVMYALTH